jgi:dihydroneopterin aldolase
MPEDLMPEDLMPEDLMPEGAASDGPGSAEGPAASLRDWYDSIELRGLRFVGAHGALPEESLRAQPFEVDLELLADLREAGSTDDLGATIDYGPLCQAVKAVIEGPHVNLLEHLAQQVADRVLEIGGERALGVVVTVRKLRPPVPVELASAAVRICRP